VYYKIAARVVGGWVSDQLKPAFYLLAPPESFCYTGSIMAMFASPTPFSSPQLPSAVRHCAHSSDQPSAFRTPHWGVTKAVTPRSYCPFF